MPIFEDQIFKVTLDDQFTATAVKAANTVYEAFSKISNNIENALGTAMSNVEMKVGDISIKQVWQARKAGKFVPMSTTGIGSGGSGGVDDGSAGSSVEIFKNAIDKFAKSVSKSSGDVDDNNKKGIFSKIFGFLVSPFTQSFKLLSGVFKGIFSKAFGALGIGAMMGKMFEPLTDAMEVILAPILQAVAPMLLNLAQAFVPFIQQIIPLINDMLSTIMPVLIDVVSNILPMFADMFSQIAVNIKPLIPVLSEVFMELVPIWITTFQLLADLIPPVIDIFKALMPLFVGFVKLLSGVAHVILTVVKPVLEGIVTLLESIFGPFKSSNSDDFENARLKTFDEEYPIMGLPPLPEGVESVGVGGELIGSMGKLTDAIDRMNESYLLQLARNIPDLKDVADDLMNQIHDNNMNKMDVEAHYRKYQTDALREFYKTGNMPKHPIPHSQLPSGMGLPYSWANDVDKMDELGDLLGISVHSAGIRQNWTNLTTFASSAFSRARTDEVKALALAGVRRSLGNYGQYSSVVADKHMKLTTQLLQSILNTNVSFSENLYSNTIRNDMASGLGDN